MKYRDAFIAYYVVAAVSGMCSIFVATTLCTLGSLRTAATQLLLMLHVTLLVEELTSLPYVFNHVEGLCPAIAFVHYYSGLANAMATGLLVVSYRYHLLEDSHGVMDFISKYSLYIVTLFPLITVLPFTTNSYTNDNEVWCTMQTDTWMTNLWAFVVFFSWAWLILLWSTGVLMRTMYQVYTVDKESGINLLSTTGMYAIISILSWLPRTAVRFSHFGAGDMDNLSFLYAYFPFYIAGIAYTAVFMGEKKALLMFDRLSDWTGESSGNLDVVGASFSWENSMRSVRIPSTTSSQNNDRFSPKRGVYSALIPEQYLQE